MTTFTYSYNLEKWWKIQGRYGKDQFLTNKLSKRTLTEKKKHLPNLNGKMVSKFVMEKLVASRSA